MMKIKLIVMGNKMPEWVASGYQEYAKRLPRQCQLELVEIPLQTRTKNANLTDIIASEGNKMLGAIAPGDHVVAMHITDDIWSTAKLAEHLHNWQNQGKDIAILVGGPEGLAPSCLKRAHQKWSLSALTLPHLMVRIIVAEQIYRAWSILQGHPYHK